MLESAQAAPVLPENRALRERFLGSMFGSAQGNCRENRVPCLFWAFTWREFCQEHRAPCWFLREMLRSAGSRFRNTDASPRCNEKQISKPFLHLESCETDCTYVPCSYTPDFCCFPRQNGCNCPIYRDSTCSAPWKFAKFAVF